MTCNYLVHASDLEKLRVLALKILKSLFQWNLKVQLIGSEQTSKNCRTVCSTLNVTGTAFDSENDIPFWTKYYREHIGMNWASSPYMADSPNASLTFDRSVNERFAFIATVSLKNSEKIRQKCSFRTRDGAIRRLAWPICSATSKVYSQLGGS